MAYWKDSVQVATADVAVTAGSARGRLYGVEGVVKLVNNRRRDPVDPILLGLFLFFDKGGIAPPLPPFSLDTYKFCEIFQLVL